MGNLGVLVLDEVTEGKDSSTVQNFVLGTIGALIGTAIIMFIQQRFSLTNKNMLLTQIFIFVLCSVAFALGISDAFNGIGFYLAFAPQLLLTGALQSAQRSLYSSLIPMGMEAAMFSFYAITDKGSSLIGTFVSGVVHTYTGSYVHVFWYSSLAFLLSAIILIFVDVEKGIEAAMAANEPSVKDEPAQKMGRGLDSA